jgi:hypothetical protein
MTDLEDISMKPWILIFRIIIPNFEAIEMKSMYFVCKLSVNFGRPGSEN